GTQGSRGGVVRLFHVTNGSCRFVARIGYLLAVILALGCGQLLLAQAFTSSITGAVTDPSGATVSGAKVTLQNMNTNDVREFTTSGDGSYQFNNLQPGTYKITVTMAGFQTYVRDNLVLQANRATSVDV